MTAPGSSTSGASDLASVVDVAQECTSAGLVPAVGHENAWSGFGVFVQARPGSHLGWVRVAMVQDRRTVWTGNVGDDAASSSELRDAIVRHAAGAGQMALFGAVA